MERADRFHRALLAIVLRPDLIVRVRRKLPEPIPTLIIGEEALHRKAAVVLQVNHRAFDRRIPGVTHLTLNNALSSSAILGKQSCSGNSHEGRYGAAR